MQISNALSSNNQIHQQTSEFITAEIQDRQSAKSTTHNLEKMMVEVNGLINRIDNVNEENLSEIIGVDIKNTNDNDES